MEQGREHLARPLLQWGLHRGILAGFFSELRKQEWQTSRTEAAHTSPTPATRMASTTVHLTEHKVPLISATDTEVVPTHYI